MMSKPTAALFFPQALASAADWPDLEKNHGLTRKDLQWLGHVKLATHTLRMGQASPMIAQNLLLAPAGAPAVALTGCFVLSPTPDDNGQILYAPYSGITKFASRAALTAHLKSLLATASEEHELLALMSLSARKTLGAATDIEVTFQAIDGDVFEAWSAAIDNARRDNDQAVLGELKQLPTLAALLETLLNQVLQAAFPGLEQSRTRVSFHAETSTDTTPGQNNVSARPWVSSMSLSDAALSYFRHQRWPAGQRPVFSHPQRAPLANDQQHWANAVENVANTLASQLSSRLQHFWNAPSVDGRTRRDFCTQATLETARAQVLLKREAQIISPGQSQVLHTLIEPTTQDARTLTLETIRLWEYPANYVELAGSLMISQEHSTAFLYTPVQGLQVLKDYQDLKDTLLNKFNTAGLEDELYDLLSLEERNRFIGFHQPQVSGQAISGSIFKQLFEAIIGKQLQNMEYALQVFRHSDGAVDIRALFDKALDIRSMISRQLLTLDTQGRWSTRPVVSGRQQPSMVPADTAATYLKSLRDVQSLIHTEFVAQPVGALALQRLYLEKMRPELAHSLSLGVRAEATLRELNGTLRNVDWNIVDSVFNPDRADRKSRRAVKGFHPDAYSLFVECSGSNEALPLAHCILMTERGGLDDRHSGHAVLWTPAASLEVFETVAIARQQLNRRLLHPQKRLELLENLSPPQRKFHQRYSLHSLRLIKGNVLHYLGQSAIDHFLAYCDQMRSRKLQLPLASTSLKDLTQTVIDSNLTRAAQIAQAIIHQQTLPAWLSTATVEQQRLHIELLQRYHDNVTDDKDYLHGMKTLEEYVRQTLNTLLKSRFPGKPHDPDLIEITPNLALAGPAQSLTAFALNHVNIAQGSGFRIASKTTQALAEGLNQTAVRQLLLSLDIPNAFAKRVNDTLSGAEAAARKLRFVRQVPWQLMQHAHALKLQQSLSASAFDLITQVLDMPDSIARAAVEGAHAIARPLELIKTQGAAAVKALGLYLIGPGGAIQGPQILYTPYHAGSVFTEFANEADVVAAINSPGMLQDLIIRRLPESAQATFKNLLQSTVGLTSEITLASNPIEGNLLSRLFTDNTDLLSNMLKSQSDTTAQEDWQAVKHLFSAGINLIATHLPGKLAYVQFLWQSYKDFKDSAENLQNHHWKGAVKAFIDGAAQMATLGRLALETPAIAAPTTATPVEKPPAALTWNHIRPTAPERTALQPFEATTVALHDLTRQNTDGTYVDRVTGQRYAAVAGKVYRVAKTGINWHIDNGRQTGPTLLSTPSRQWVIDPDLHTVHFGKALSTLHNRYEVARQVRNTLNIEARGMAEIRAHHPEKARMIVQAIDMARYYAFNSLHNLVQLRKLLPGTRLDTFLKRFFDIDHVDHTLLDKIKQVIVPICKALVDPNEDLMNSDRFIVGSSKYEQHKLIAFVMDKDDKKNVHFTERFFDQQLDWYKSCLTEPFDVDGHSQAATLIHEFAHLYCKAVDIASLEARRPFLDLIAPITGFGAAMKNRQMEFQREALSLGSVKEALFARWNSALNVWQSLDSIPGLDHVGKEILATTKTRTLQQARDAFMNRVDPHPRIDTILRNADSIAFLVCEMGRQLDPEPATSP